MGENIIFLLAGLGLLGFGVYKAYQTWKHKRWIDNAKAWPVTNGTVTHEWTDSQGRNGNHYYAVIEFTYTVMGSKYRGSTTKDALFNSKAFANEFCYLHPEGSILEVRYNPIDPELYVVEFDSVTSYEIFGFAMPAIIGLSFVFFAWTKLTGK